MDVAGIYMGVHWVNPGNVLRCNYVEEGGHCLYLDWCASGVTVDGLVCLRTADGLKLNTGKNNNVKGMIVIDSKEPANGYISCQNYDQNNCDVGTGKGWAESLKSTYQTPGIKKLFPFLTGLCSKTSVRGVNCNAGTSSQYGPAKTGRCSGLPTDNNVQIASVVSPGDKMDRMVFYQDNCKTFPSVPKMNTMVYVKTNTTEAKFVNFKNRNMALQKGSSILKVFPKFRSCPNAKIGPKPMKYAGYMNLFNMVKPAAKPITARPMGVTAYSTASVADVESPAFNPYASPTATMIRNMEKGLQ
eukprot:TRINITY_DN20033_c0_g1_i4.p1 TRINITY_DN20033_c0_g1~~TRINITY_DN20033_c0_g1_i4.p1  ORF type:complete len:308 (-),score=22.47 TRINITY_DN20033_c0_g1_i4:130-1032(-)